MALSLAEADTLLNEFSTKLSKEDKAIYEKLCFERRPKRAALTKAINAINPVLADPSCSKQALQIHVDRINDALKALDEADQKVWEFIRNERGIQADIVLGQSYSNQALQVLIQAQTKINRLIAVHC